MLKQQEFILTENNVSDLMENLFHLYKDYGETCIVVSSINLFDMKYIDWGTGRMCVENDFNVMLWNCAHSLDSSNTGKLDVEYTGDVGEWMGCCMEWLRVKGSKTVREYWMGRMSELETKEEKENDKNNDKENN